MALSVTIDDVQDFGAFRRVIFTVTSNEATCTLDLGHSGFVHQGIGPRGFGRPKIRRASAGTIDSTGYLLESVPASAEGIQNHVEVWASEDDNVIAVEQERLHGLTAYTARVRIDRQWFDREVGS